MKPRTSLLLLSILILIALGGIFFFSLSNREPAQAAGRIIVKARDLPGNETRAEV